ncbi:MAG TPA: hypothetical protein VLF91_01425 [Candidatus Saccharimonadales bacterium]|nr:hypothetical protein [Candidatus Saccharimonadales bacterium]
MATVSYWNGSIWVSVDITHFSYWNGSAWTAPSDVKYWDGAAWQTVFGGGGGGSSIALRAATNNTASSSSSLNLTVPATTQVGDLLVLVVGQTSFSGGGLFNAISGWTKQGEQRANTASMTLGVYTRLAQAGDASSTVTSTSINSANYSGQIRAYTNVNQTTPIDAAIVFSQAAASTTASAPAITTVTNGAEVVTFFAIPTQAGTTVTGTDFTDPTGFANELVVCTNTGSNNAAIAVYDENFASSGAEGPFGITCTQSRNWALATVAIRPT